MEFSFNLLNANEFSFNLLNEAGNLGSSFPPNQTFDKWKLSEKIGFGTIR